MIKEKELEIGINNKNITYYRNKGYTFVKYQNKLNIKIEDLNPESHQKITAICELCQTEIQLVYYKYLRNKNNHGFYGCKKCSRTKFKMTCQKNWGSDHYMKTDKGKQTSIDGCMKKYGVTNSMLDPEVQKKIQKTIFERFGNRSALRHPDIIEKTKKTLLIQHGVDHYTKSQEYKKRMYDHNLKLFNDKMINQYHLKTDHFVIKEIGKLEILCDKCSNWYDISYQNYKQRIDRYRVESCVLCNPLDNHISWGQQDVFNYISQFVDVEMDNKKMLDGKHIDVYAPNLKFGIEYNGVFWHSEALKSNMNHHHDKSMLAMKNGVRLFHLYENYWQNEQDHIKTLLRTNITKDFVVFLDCDVIRVENFTLLNIFNYKSFKNTEKYALKMNDVVLGEIGLKRSDNSIIYFSFDPRFSADLVFDTFVSELRLEGCLYVHDLNNVFLDISKHEIVDFKGPSYSYVDMNDKTELAIVNKHEVERIHKTHQKCLENKYYRLYDSGYVNVRLN